MKKEQVVAAIAAIGGVENIGYIQVRNEPFFFVTGTPDETHEELRYNAVEFDEVNELVLISKVQGVDRVYPFDQVNAILSKEAARGTFPKYDMWAHAQNLHNQTPNRRFEV